MANILHIDSSPRGESSQSRKLAKTFIDEWQKRYPEDIVTYRDLRQTSIPHVSEAWVIANFTPPDARTLEMVQALRLSDELVDEFLAADRCVFSVPMYNFSPPSIFKAYIDHVARIGRTFAFEDGQSKGLVTDKPILFITARGVLYGPGSPYQGWDCQEPALRYIFQFLGVSDIQFIHASGLDLGDAAKQQGLSEAMAQIQDSVVKW